MNETFAGLWVDRLTRSENFDCHSNLQRIVLGSKDYCKAADSNDRANTIAADALRKPRQRNVRYAQGSALTSAQFMSEASITL